jgi:hypothetical protein
VALGAAKLKDFAIIAHEVDAVAGIERAAAEVARVDPHQGWLRLATWGGGGGSVVFEWLRARVWRGENWALWLTM